MVVFFGMGDGCATPFHPQLRQSGRKHVILDVVMVFGCLVAFQIVFFFLGQRYAYTSSPEMVHDLIQRYDHATEHAAEQAVPPPPLSPEEQLALTRTAVELVQTHAMPVVDSLLARASSTVVPAWNGVAMPSAAVSPPPPWLMGGSGGAGAIPPAWSAMAQAAATGFVKTNL